MPTSSPIQRDSRWRSSSNPDRRSSAAAVATRNGSPRPDTWAVDANRALPTHCKGETKNTQAATQTPVSAATAADLAGSPPIETIGINILRYALVLIFVLFGTFKFTAAEAAAIKPLVSNSPFMSWLYAVLSDQGVSNVIGTTELIAAALIAIRPFSARASAIGSAIAVGTFVTTLSFLFTTPGALSPMHPAHGFLLKDVVLLGAAVAIGTEAVHAAASGAEGR